MIHTYLSSLIAENNETLDINPHGTIAYEPTREQLVEIYDDGSEERISADDDYNFLIDVRWERVSPGDHYDIMDFFYSNAKGAGVTETFYWEHPNDGHIYTVRFMSKPQQSQTPDKKYDISAKLKVIGVRPEGVGLMEQGSVWVDLGLGTTETFYFIEYYDSTT